MSELLLSIQDLRVAFRMGQRGGVVQRAEAVGRGAEGIGFDVPENCTLALVGESGSGKSLTAMSIVNLLPDNAERAGRILYRGQDLLRVDAAHMRALRGRALSLRALGGVLAAGVVLPAQRSNHACRDRAGDLAERPLASDH